MKKELYIRSFVNLTDEEEKELDKIYTLLQEYDSYFTYYYMLISIDFYENETIDKDEYFSIEDWEEGKALNWMLENHSTEDAIKYANRFGLRFSEQQAEKALCNFYLKLVKELGSRVNEKGYLSHDYLTLSAAYIRNSELPPKWNEFAASALPSASEFYNFLNTLQTDTSLRTEYALKLHNQYIKKFSA